MSKNLYELCDILETFGTKTAIAEAMNIHKSAVTRWGDEEIPGWRQFQLMRLFDENEYLNRRYESVKRKRKRAERDKDRG